MPSPSLHAYVILKELVPTLYVDGDISSHGEKVMISLKEKTPQGFSDSELLLEFQPDVYDPAGQSSSTINKFSKALKSPEQYSTVKIIGLKGEINLRVEKRE